MSFSFTLVQLRYFQAVASCGSMTAAAASLNVSQAAVSTSMAQLERSLGVQLFIRRHNRSLVLSAAGRRLASEADALLDHADELSRSARGLGEGLSGSVTVGIFAPMAPFRLPQILVEFERRYPQVAVEFIEADLAELQKALHFGTCEIALMYGLGLGSGLQSRVLDVIPPHVLVSLDHPAASANEPVHLRDFAHEPQIQLGLPHSKQYYEELFRLVEVAPRVRHSFTGYETVRSFVGMGHGYAVLNQRATMQAFSNPLTRELEIADDLPGIEVMLVWPEHARLTRRAAAFAEVCHDVYRERHRP